MSGFRIFLFGPPRMESNGKPIPQGRHKGLALLAYLAQTGSPHSRDAIIDILWPAFAPEDARNNLRRELSILKKVLPDGALFTDRHMLGLELRLLRDGSISVDTHEFSAEIQQTSAHIPRGGIISDKCAAAFEAAVKLFQDDFLAGFTLPDSPAFDEWQFHQSESLRGDLATALESLVEWNESRSDIDRALKYAQRWHSLDPFHAPANEGLMRLYEANGQQAAALRQYEKYSQILKQELHVDPEETTTELYEAIRTRRVSSHSQIRKTITRTRPNKAETTVNLPADTTPFIGREREMAQLLELLVNPQTRLINVIGVGGMGKTRLALAVAQRIAKSSHGDIFPDGIYFVPMAPVATTRMIAPTLALGIGFTPGSEGDPAQQVISHLKPLRALIVVDNLEHLVDSESALFFADLISGAPGIKLLATSRMRIGLNGEYLFTLDGLIVDSESGSVGMATPHDGPHVSDAIMLFVEAARRTTPTFQLTPEGLATIRQICALVWGMPLGIELAAAWVELLSLDAILDELKRSLDFLNTTQADTPARQSSLKAVFDSSWHLLPQEEQKVLSYLSIFPSSFDRGAAEAVAGASLRTLLSLRNKSWLQPAASNRYQIHPLLRQFVVQRISPGGMSEGVLRDIHAAYYTGLVAELDERMRGSQPDAAFERVTDELDNLLVAMLWMVGNDRVKEVVDQVATPLLRYLESRYRYFIFRPLISEAISRAAAAHLDRTRGILLSLQGAFFFDGYPTRFMDYQWIGPFWQSLMQEAWDLVPIDLNVVNFWDIVVGWQYGRFVEIRTGIERVRDVIHYLTGSDRHWEEAFARQSLGRLLTLRKVASPEFKADSEAADSLLAALDFFETLEDEREAAITLSFLGYERQATGDLDGAKQLLFRAQSRLKALGEEIIAANINWRLAEIHLQQGEMRQALAYFHEMAEILLENGLSQMAISILSRESYESVRYGDLDNAMRLRQQAIALSVQTGEQFDEAWDYWEMGEIYRVMGRPDKARQWNERSRAKFHALQITDTESFYFRMLGDLALADGDAAAADSYFRNTILQAEETDHPWQKAYGLAGLATAAILDGRITDATGLLIESLTQASNSGDPGGLVLVAVARVARFFKAIDQPDRSAQLAQFILGHSMAWQETRHEAAMLLAIPLTQLSARQDAPPIALKPIVDQLITELSTMR